MCLLASRKVWLIFFSVQDEAEILPVLRYEHAYEVPFTENLYVESTFKHALYIFREIYLKTMSILVETHSESRLPSHQLGPVKITSKKAKQRMLNLPYQYAVKSINFSTVSITQQ